MLIAVRITFIAGDSSGALTVQTKCGNHQVMLLTTVFIAVKHFNLFTENVLCMYVHEVHS